MNYFQQFPDNNDYNNNNNYNAYNPYNGVNGQNNYENPYDVEYEHRSRVETEKAQILLTEIDKKHSEECTLNVAAQWNFETNVNEASQLDAVSWFNFLNQSDIDLNIEIFFPTRARLSNH